MDSRERITRLLNLEEPDRIGYVDEIDTWPETLDRWEKEGMPDIRRCFLNDRSIISFDPRNQLIDRKAPANKRIT
jgi:hypothetical protein